MMECFMDDTQTELYEVRQYSLQVILTSPVFGTKCSTRWVLHCHPIYWTTWPFRCHAMILLMKTAIEVAGSEAGQPHHQRFRQRTACRPGHPRWRCKETQGWLNKNSLNTIAHGTTFLRQSFVFATSSERKRRIDTASWRGGTNDDLCCFYDRTKRRQKCIKKLWGLPSFMISLIKRTRLFKTLCIKER